MKTREMERALAAADPAGPGRLDCFDVEAQEADLLADIEGEQAAPLGNEPRRPRSRSRRRLVLALGSAAVAVTLATFFILAGGGSERSSRAYGAELIRFAETTPLLLLEGGGWGIRNINQFESHEGRMEFTKPSPDPHPDEPLMTRSDVKRGITPVSVQRRRQRRVELTWHDGKQYRLLWHDGKLGTSFYDPYLHKRVQSYEPGRSFKTTITALRVTAYVDPRAETAPIQGGPGDRVMVAIWEEDGRLLELRASAPDLAAFRERLDRLRRVGAEEWLDALPANVVKAADYGAAIKEILRGIPLPPGFDPSTIRDLDLTTDRYQVGAEVGGAVACAWFHHWGEARADHDALAAQEAERILLESEKRWPIFREMAKEGAYPATVIEYAKKMPSGRWYGRPLLVAVDSEEGLCGAGSAAAGG